MKSGESNGFTERYVDHRASGPSARAHESAPPLSHPSRAPSRGRNASCPRAPYPAPRPARSIGASWEKAVRAGVMRMGANLRPASSAKACPGACMSGRGPAGGHPLEEPCMMRSRGRGQIVLGILRLASGVVERIRGAGPSRLARCPLTWAVDHELVAEVNVNLAGASGHGGPGKRARLGGQHSPGYPGAW